MWVVIADIFETIRCHWSFIFSTFARKKRSLHKVSDFASAGRRKRRTSLAALRQSIELITRVSSFRSQAASTLNLRCLAHGPA